jgi:hypothetical protein
VFKILKKKFTVAVKQLLALVCISLVSAAPLENAFGQEERQLGVEEPVYGHW